jgi:AcrR family transcriptional regulator
VVRLDPSRILDAAQSVFAQNGVDGSSIRAIAKEAKCDPSLLYYHFLNKEAIFVAILERKFGRLIPDLEDVADAYRAQTHGGARKAACSADGRTPLQEALWQTILVLHRHVKDDAGFRGMIRGNVAAGQAFAQDELLKCIARVVQTIQGYLSDGVESGELRGDMDLGAAAFFFIRTSIDILDFFPMFATKLTPAPSEEAIDLAERQWFQLFWAGMLNGPRKTAANGPQPPQGPPSGKAARRMPARGAAKEPENPAVGLHQKETKRGSGWDDEAANFSGTGRDASPSSSAKRSKTAVSGAKLNGPISSGAERGASPSSGDAPPPSRAKRSKATVSGAKLNGTISSGVERGASPSSDAKQGGGSSPPSSARRGKPPSKGAGHQAPPALQRQATR